MYKGILVAVVLAAAIHSFFDIGKTPEEVRAYIQTQEYKDAERYYLSR